MTLSRFAAFLWIASALLTGHLGLAQAQGTFLTHPVSKAIEQSKTNASTTPDATPEAIQNQIVQLAKDRAAVLDQLKERRNELALGTTLPKSDKEALAKTIETLSITVARYDHTIDALHGLARLAREVADKRDRLVNWQPPKSGPPWPLVLGDETYVTMQETEREQQRLIQTAKLVSAQRDILLHKRKELQAEIRQASQPSGIGSSSSSPGNLPELRRAQSELSAVDIDLVFADLNLQVNELRQEGLSLTHQISQKNWTYFDNRFFLDQPAYERVIKLLESDLTRVHDREIKAREVLGLAITASTEASERLYEQQRADNADGDAIIAAERGVILADARASLAELQRNVLFYTGESISIRKKLWQIRYSLYNPSTETPPDLHALNETYGNIANELDSWIEYDMAQVNAKSRQLRELLDRSVLTPTIEEGDFLRERANITREQITTFGDAAREIESTKLLLQLTLNEIQLFKEKSALWLKVGYWLTETRGMLSAIWHYELFTATDTIIVEGRAITTQRSITIGKSVGAILILVLGFLLVQRVIKAFMSLALKRSKISRNTLVVVARWTTLLAGMTLIVFSFILVDIPLSIFAFAGGALAIGIGFGAQNLLQNLISGLMLLIEKPVRVGDWVEVGNVTGSVTSIGLRFSTILSSTGTETLVPNSVLVQEKLVNWTYSSPEVRREIQVSVDFKSDPEQVTHILLNIASDHPVILELPKPRVLLDSFTDQGMLFKLQFWAPMIANASGPVIMSEVRREIYARFAEYGIDFSYPHRTVTIERASASEPPSPAREI
jgi:potassium efflux system protein